MKIIYNKETDTFGLICNRAETAAITVFFGHISMDELKEKATWLFPRADDKQIDAMPSGQQYFTQLNKAFTVNEDFVALTHDEGF
jgi:hypothetical protein